MNIEFTPYIRSVFSSPNIRMVGSFLSQHKRIAAIVATALTGFAAYYFINRRPVVQPNQDSLLSHKTKEVETPKTREVQSPNLRAGQESNSDQALPPDNEPLELVVRVQNPPPAEPPRSVRQITKDHFVSAPNTAKDESSSDSELQLSEEESEDELKKATSQEKGTQDPEESHSASSSEQVQLREKSSDSSSDTETPNQKHVENEITESPPVPPHIDWANLYAKMKGAGKGAIQGFNEGLDLTPELLKTFRMILEAKQAGADYWNTPSQPLDPFTTNLMVGFLRNFGKNLHFLLLNTTKIHGPEFAGELLTKLQIVDRAGKIAVNEMLKFSNPLGWGSLILQFANFGVNLIDFLGAGGMVERIHKWQLSYLKKLGICTLDLDWFREEKNYQIAEKIFKDEDDRYLKDRAAERKRIESETSGLRSVVDYLFPECQRNPGPPPESYEIAKKAMVVAKKAFDDVKKEWKADAEQKHDTKTKPSKTIHDGIIQPLVTFLDKTTEKTLTSLLEMLEQEIDSNSTIPQISKETVKTVLKAVVLGNSSLKQLENKKVTEASNWLNGHSKWIKQIAAKPLSLVPAVPASFNNTYRAYAKPVNRAMGRGVAVAVNTLQLNKRAIDNLKLKKLELYIGKQPVNIKITDLLPDGVRDSEFGDLSQMLVERAVKKCLPRTKEIFNCDQMVQELIQAIGEQIADILSRGLASHLISTSQYNYTPEQLMTEEVFHNIFDKCFSGMLDKCRR